jgi:hypothetical protein
MAWQKFQSTNQRFEERISINPNNSFGFPKRFYEENNLDSFKYLVIFYNPEESAIGFQFTSSEEEKHKFRILRSKKQFGINVTAKSFFKTYNLDPNIYKGKYNAEKKQIEGIGPLYVIFLNKNSETKTNIPTEEVKELISPGDTPQPDMQTSTAPVQPALSTPEASAQPVVDTPVSPTQPLPTPTTEV